MADERGRLKVFIGMAPGVGKTYRMLQEGAAEADSGLDVAIGYLEPHGRAETLAQAEGLELVPRRTVEYRGKPLEEMDLPAVIARRPELCLIDELAHTNAPGVEHEKRYEDVRDVLEAGIDVFSTVNVQHLESLNDQVAQLTGAQVRETIPDEVLSMADEVVLIDLTPEALIARLRAGKVYRPERVQAALNNFFKIENLAALRETALRQVAEDIEVKRLGREPSGIVRRDEEGLPAAAESVRRRSPSDCWRWRRSRRTPSGSCAGRGALGAAPGRRARRARRAKPPNGRRTPRIASAWRRCGSPWSRCWGARLHVEEGDDVAAIAIAQWHGAGRDRTTCYSRGTSSSVRRGSAAWAWAAARPSARWRVACCARCPASTCASWPTRACGHRSAGDAARRAAANESGDCGASRCEVSNRRSAGRARHAQQPYRAERQAGAAAIGASVVSGYLAVEELQVQGGGFSGPDDAQQPPVVDSQERGGEGREQRPGGHREHADPERPGGEPHARAGEHSLAHAAAGGEQERPDRAPPAPEPVGGGDRRLEEALAEVAGPDHQSRSHSRPEGW